MLLIQNLKQPTARYFVCLENILLSKMILNPFRVTLGCDIRYVFFTMPHPCNSNRFYRLGSICHIKSNIFSADWPQNLTQHLQLRLFLFYPTIIMHQVFHGKCIQHLYKTTITFDQSIVIVHKLTVKYSVP